MTKTKKGADTTPKTSTASIPNKRTQTQEYWALVKMLTDVRHVQTSAERAMVESVDRHMRARIRDAASLMEHQDPGRYVDDVRATNAELAKLQQQLDQLRDAARAEYHARYSVPDYEWVLLDAYKMAVSTEICKGRAWLVAMMHLPDGLTPKEIRARVEAENKNIRARAEAQGHDMEAECLECDGHKYLICDRHQMCSFARADGSEQYERMFEHLTDALEAIARNRGDDMEAQQSLSLAQCNGYERARRYLIWAWRQRWNLKPAEHPAAPLPAPMEPQQTAKVTQFLPVPTPSHTLVQTNKLDNALTGIMEGGRMHRALESGHAVILNLSDGRNRNNLGELHVAVKDPKWEPIDPVEVDPYTRLISLVDAMRLSHGPCFPYAVPVTSILQWVYGNVSRRDYEPRKQDLLLLLTKLRRSVSIDWRNMPPEAAARAVAELGYKNVASLPLDAPLVNTSRDLVIDLVNRNGAVGECITFYDFPMEYVFSIATGQLLRIPDALTSISGRVGHELKKVKAFLLHRIAAMYSAGGAIGDRISLKEFYRFTGTDGNRDAEYNARQRARTCLDAWAAPRDIPDIGMCNLIASWDMGKNSMRIGLVHGGLGALRGYLA